jgi:hypothetical protein
MEMLQIHTLIVFISKANSCVNPCKCSHDLSHQTSHSITVRATVISNEHRITIHEHDNHIFVAIFILEEGKKPTTPWVGGEYFLAILSMNVDDTMKVREIYLGQKSPHDTRYTHSKSIQKCWRLP